MLRSIQLQLVLVLLTVSGIYSCCDDCDVCEEPGACHTTTGIYGDWEWSKSFGGFSGNTTLTPASVGYTKSVVFDDYYFYEYLNDTLHLQSQYDLQIKSQEFLGINEYLTLENGGELAIELAGDTLRLYDLCPDCFFHEYIRN